MVMEDERSLKRLWDLRNLLNGEWIPDVLVALSSGPLRRAELLERIRSTRVPNGWSESNTRNLADTVMQRTLVRLEMSEMVEHTRDERVFPPVSLYQLSSAAEELLAALEGPVEWAEKNADLIRRVQQRRRRSEDAET
jgi:DNA-binding HxlR family transcriptional regulator